MKKFKINNPVGNNLYSDPEDVRATRSSLVSLGYKDKNPEFGYIDKTLDKNIRSFQKENNLSVDGVMLPGGPTERAIQEAMVRAPIIRCRQCGTPHGGSQGSLCPDCALKQ